MKGREYDVTLRLSDAEEIQLDRPQFDRVNQKNEFLRRPLYSATKISVASS